MAETRTDYFELPQWSLDTPDGPSREDFNGAFANLEARSAYDDGGQASALPSTLLKPGRYAKQTVTGGYQVHRRNNAGGWDFVGGSVVPIRQRFRGAASGDIVLSTDVAAGADAATLKAGGELATPGIVRSSAVGAFGADLAADLTVPGTTGRLYARTRASGERGVVSSAHDDAAGPLFSAQEVGGTYPWIVDSRGRMKSTVPSALGAANLTTNVPLVIAPSATDVTALDLYAKANGTPIPGLRIFRTAGDADPIALMLPDSITLGRASWTGATIDLRAPAIGLTGASAVTGTLGVSGQGTFAGGVTAEATKLNSYTSNGTTGWRSSVKVASGTVLDSRDIRHSLDWRIREVNIEALMSTQSQVELTFYEITPTTNCYLDLSLTLSVHAFGPGASGGVEPVTAIMGYRILNAASDTVLFTSDIVYDVTVGAFDPHDTAGRGQAVINDICPLALTAGTTYRIQLRGQRLASFGVSAVLKHVIGTVREAEYMGALS